MGLKIFTEDQMGGAHGMYGGGETCIRVFRG
jgi:hypothetical protein